MVTSNADRKDSDNDDFDFEEAGDTIGQIAIPSPTVNAFGGNEQAKGLRNRHAGASNDDQWEMAQEQAAGMRYVPESELSSGGQNKPWLIRRILCCGERLKALPKYYGMVEGTGKAFHLLDPETLIKWFPDAEGLKDPNSQTYQALSRLAGPFSALMYTLFFSFLPQVFKFLAFYDGTSSSMEKAERYALLLYWYFMLVTAFTGTALANLFFTWINAERTAEESIRATLNAVAASIPNTLAPTFLNWIIMRYSFTWPGGYLFQMNAFITRALNMKWCNRIMRGMSCPKHI
ncbi:MAG: hypothetical protein SGARI_005121, partial [Bacillariaceae sp.]